MKGRNASLKRTTLETAIEVSVNLDGTGIASVSTGEAFFDHILCALAAHSMIDIRVDVSAADLNAGCHHLVEDTGFCLGTAINRAHASGGRTRRFAWALVPMDESLVRAVLDISGRPFAQVDIGRGAAGGVTAEDMVEFFRAFAVSLAATIHIDVLRSQNAHHAMEAAAKGLALCLRQALEADRRAEGSASTKGEVLIE